MASRKVKSNSHVYILLQIAVKPTVALELNCLLKLGFSMKAGGLAPSDLFLAIQPCGLF
jgi:hypothetical protein